MPDSSASPTVDLSKRWTQHLRENANTSVSYTCPNCPDRKFQQTEEDLWKHTISHHANLLPQHTDRAAYQEFRRDLKIRGLEKGYSSLLKKSQRNGFSRHTRLTIYDLDLRQNHNYKLREYCLEIRKISLLEMRSQIPPQTRANDLSLLLPI